MGCQARCGNRIVGGPQDPDPILEWIDSEDQVFGYDLVRRRLQKDFFQPGMAVRLPILRGDVPWALVPCLPMTTGSAACTFSFAVTRTAGSPCITTMMHVQGGSPA